MYPAAGLTIFHGKSRNAALSAVRKVNYGCRWVGMTPCVVGACLDAMATYGESTVRQQPPYLRRSYHEAPEGSVETFSSCVGNGSREGEKTQEEPGWVTCGGDCRKSFIHSILRELELPRFFLIGRELGGKGRFWIFGASAILWSNWIKKVLVYGGLWYFLDLPGRIS